MKIKTNKKIGILDGMGAFAGARFFQMTLEKIAKANLPFPEFILNAVAIDDFFADTNKILPAQKILSERVKVFNNQKVTMIVMACNTAHIMHAHLSSISKSPFPSIIDLVIGQSVKQSLSRVGVLASAVSLKTKLFENELIKNNILAFVPNQNFEIFLQKLIGKVINNKINMADKKNFEIFTKKFILDNNLDGIILGCTELPLAFDKKKFSNIKILDSLDILADCVVEHIKC